MNRSRTGRTAKLTAYITPKTKERVAVWAHSVGYSQATAIEVLLSRQLDAIDADPGAPGAKA